MYIYIYIIYTYIYIYKCIVRTHGLVWNLELLGEHHSKEHTDTGHRREGRPEQSQNSAHGTVTLSDVDGRPDARGVIVRAAHEVEVG